MNAPKTAADVHKENAEKKALMSGIIKVMELRKLAVQRTVEICSGLFYTMDQIEDIANFFYGFITDTEPKPEPEDNEDGSKIL